MANNFQAFERLLLSIPKFESGPDFSPSKVLDYYTSLEKTYQSELFVSPLLVQKLDQYKVNQHVYDKCILKIKEISRLVDELYNVKYN